MDHYERLVARCVEALATFDPSSTSVEDHLERFLVSSEKMVGLMVWRVGWRTVGLLATGRGGGGGGGGDVCEGSGGWLRQIPAAH